MSAKTLNVVVLAAGASQRFVDAGVSVPKPLLEFRNITLLERTISLARELRKGNGRIVVVATRSVAAAVRASDVMVIPVDVIQRGPAASALLASAVLPEREPVVFVDCDNYYPSDQRTWTDNLPVGEEFLAGYELAQPHPDFCSIVRNQNGAVTSLDEKMATSTLVATGVYGFSSFIKFAHLAMVELTTDSARQEAPMSRVLGRSHWRPKVVMVEAWLPVGTPAQMKEAASVISSGI